jgi:hypothetical protein
MYKDLTRVLQQKETQTEEFNGFYSSKTTNTEPKLTDRPLA